VFCHCCISYDAHSTFFLLIHSGTPRAQTTSKRSSSAYIKTSPTPRLYLNLPTTCTSAPRLTHYSTDDTLHLLHYQSLPQTRKMSNSTVPCRAPYSPVTANAQDATVTVSVGSGYNMETFELSVPFLCKGSGYFEDRYRIPLTHPALQIPHHRRGLDFYTATPT
jgi:hypothetical protein